MEPQGSIGQSWIFGAIAVALPVLFFLFFKTMTAKSRKTYFVGTALIAVIMLSFFAIMTESGLMPSLEEVRQHQAEAPPLKEVLSNVPTSVSVAFGFTAVIWIGGGNWILIRQTRKAGRRWWEYLNPLNPPFRDMDWKAWAQMALLGVFALFAASIGAQLTAERPPDAPNLQSEN
jgi:hypothetical protein